MKRTEGQQRKYKIFNWKYGRRFLKLEIFPPELNSYNMWQSLTPKPPRHTWILLYHIATSGTQPKFRWVTLYSHLVCVGFSTLQFTLKYTRRAKVLPRMRTHLVHSKHPRMVSRSGCKLHVSKGKGSKSSTGRSVPGLCFKLYSKALEGDWSRAQTIGKADREGRLGSEWAKRIVSRHLEFPNCNNSKHR